MSSTTINTKQHSTHKRAKKYRIVKELNIVDLLDGTVLVKEFNEIITLIGPCMSKAKSIYEKNTRYIKVIGVTPEEIEELNTVSQEEYEKKVEYYKKRSFVTDVVKLSVKVYYRDMGYKVREVNLVIE